MHQYYIALENVDTACCRVKLIRFRLMSLSAVKKSN